METAFDRLSARDREILRDIIEAHIASGEPVSSRSVAKVSRHGLSAATVRNVMADLEESGLLAQPHTSAGRVPTPAAYHLFIGNLMASRPVSARVRHYIDENLKGIPAGADRLMSITSHLLSELSDQVGVVLTPEIGETVLKAVDFVPIHGPRLLCIVVGSNGVVESKVLEAGEVISREDLIAMSNYLTENYAGRTLRQIRDHLVALMAEERAQFDRMLSTAIALASRGLGGDDGPGVLVDGTASLLSKPEASDLGRMRRMLEAFGDKARLVQLLNRCMKGSGVRVFIGDDSELTSELNLSVVATTYGPQERPLGSLGIVGPSRMEYPKIVPLVHYLGRALSEALALGHEESR
jgi:heat-inducible transcriptional repressor